MKTLSNLQQAETLRSACESAQESLRDKAGRIDEKAQFIHWFRQATEQERATEAFQLKLWNENPIAAIGQGNIDVTPVVRDPEFREWVARELGRDLGEDVAARRKHILTVAKRLRTEFEERLPRVPQLKMLRALAVAFPSDFSNVADGRRIRTLYREMFGGPAKQPILCSFEIMDRFDEILGSPGTSAGDLATRMALPWEVYEKYVLNPDDDATEEVVSGETRLRPMPAARRRRGLTGVANGLQTILGALDFIEGGVGKEELIAHLRTLVPNYKDSSLNVIIGILTSEFGLVKRENGLLILTDRGQAFLDSQDPSEMADWLLTRVLGLDMALVALRDEGPKVRGDLMMTMRRANPGWTTNFGPSAILSWLRSFGVIDDMDGEVILTDAGKQWAERIHWNPQALKADPVIAPSAALQEAHSPSSESIDLPPIEDIIASIQAEGHFDARVIGTLHAGLWSDKQRHFAVLTGLSGTGKTLLAKAYGSALSSGGADIHQVSVQPGWYDAGALLGYVNPLRPDAYSRTGFLEFLMKAVDNPERPHIVILDEMNLSHPEQYLAPILSAMEGAGGYIELHQEGDDFDGVPQRLPYPCNLILIGTVNMDETTHGLSDKVLDRAFTLEFWEIDIDAYPKWTDFNLDQAVVNLARTVLKELYAGLRPARLHFGWRTISDVLGFLRASNISKVEAEVADNLDSVVYAKVLPKLRGDDSQRFRTALLETQDTLHRHGLNRSAERISELTEDLKSTGTARFWR